MSKRPLAVLAMLLIVLTNFSTWPQKVSASPFTDVSGNHPNAIAIQWVKDQGIASGYSDGSFKPDNKLNRAEFVKFVTNFLFFQTQITSCKTSDASGKVFPDIEHGVWYENFFCIAKEKGMVKGYPDGSSQPNKTIVFAEASKIVLEGNGVHLSGSNPWYKPYLDFLDQAQATPARLKNMADQGKRGNTEITRGEMAQILYNLRQMNTTVKSDDGNLSLKIPITALPDGVKASDISVKKVAPNDPIFQGKSSAGYVVYRLTPDGTQFKEPLQFQTTLENNNGSTPALFQLSQGKLESLEGANGVMDFATKRFSLSGEISHFSDLGVVLQGGYTVDMPEVPDVFIGEKPAIRVNIKVQGVLASASIEGALNPLGTSDGLPVLKPYLRIVDRPREKNLTAEIPYELDVSDYSCDGEGDAEIEYELRTHYTYKSETELFGAISNSVKPLSGSSSFYFFGQKFTCKKKVEVSVGCPGIDPITPGETTRNIEVYKLDGNCYSKDQFTGTTLGNTLTIYHPMTNGTAIDIASKSHPASEFLAGKTPDGTDKNKEYPEVVGSGSLEAVITISKIQFDKLAKELGNHAPSFSLESQ